MPERTWGTGGFSMVDEKDAHLDIPEESPLDISDCDLISWRILDILIDTIFEYLNSTEYPRSEEQWVLHPDLSCSLSFCSLISLHVCNYM